MKHRRVGHRPAGWVASLLLLCGCVPSGGPARLAAVGFADLPGWNRDHPAEAMPALMAGCRRLAAMPARKAMGGSREAVARGARAGDWAGVCADAARVKPDDDAATRAFLIADLQPWRMMQGARGEELFTGYYEPEMAGSRVQGGVYQTPLYGRPADLVEAGGADPGGERMIGRRENGAVVPYFDRADIERGALRGRGLEIAWLADPVDLFFLQIQGSGRIRLPNGQVMRVGYAGKNGRPYVAIGRLLVARGALMLEEANLPSIRAWLATHRAAAPALMDANPSYVFFREMRGMAADQGPTGALGVPLTPGRSVAIDPAFVPLGAPIWIDSTDPLGGGDYQRLMLAQDIGTAIKGPLRADVFYGWGHTAEVRAGQAHQSGSLYILLPRS